MFKKKKQIPDLVRPGSNMNCSPALGTRLMAVVTCSSYPTAQWLWEELWKHWANVEINVDGDRVRVNCHNDTRSLYESINDGMAGRSVKYAKIIETAPNLPDALALALLSTIGQRKTDKRGEK